MRRAANAERDAMICRWRDHGYGPREIARTTGLTIGVVSGVLNRAGRTERRVTTSPPERMAAVDLSCAAGARNAARAFHVHPRTIGRWRVTHAVGVSRAAPR